MNKENGELDQKLDKEIWKRDFLLENSEINELRQRIYPHLRSIQFVNLYRPGNQEVGVFFFFSPLFLKQFILKKIGQK